MIDALALAAVPVAPFKLPSYKKKVGRIEITEPVFTYVSRIPQVAGVIAGGVTVITVLFADVLATEGATLKVIEVVLLTAVTVFAAIVPPPLDTVITSPTRIEAKPLAVVVVIVVLLATKLQLETLNAVGVIEEWVNGRKYDSSIPVSTSTAVPAVITALVELVVTDLGRLKSNVIGIILNYNRVKNEDSTLFQGVRSCR